MSEQDITACELCIICQFELWIRIFYQYWQHKGISAIKTLLRFSGTLQILLEVLITPCIMSIRYGAQTQETNYWDLIAKTMRNNCL